MTVTTHDIARRANVSQAAVSMALNGKKGVSQATRERILAIARELGYQPDPQLSALIERRWRTREEPTGERLALLLPSHANPQRIIQAAGLRARQLGYGLEVISTREGKDPEKILWARGVRGVILIGGRDLEAFRDSIPGNLVIVECALSYTTPLYHSVMPDLIWSAHDLARRLEGTRFQKIGFGTFAPVGSATDVLREAALALLCARLGDRCVEDPVLEVQGPRTTEMNDWVRARKLDLLIGVNDYFPETLLATDFAIPRDLAVLSIAAREENPHVSGYCRDDPQMAVRAVERVAAGLARLEFGPPPHRETILVSSLWRQGETFPQDA